MDTISPTICQGYPLLPDIFEIFFSTEYNGAITVVTQQREKQVSTKVKRQMIAATKTIGLSQYGLLLLCNSPRIIYDLSK